MTPERAEDREAGRKSVRELCSQFADQLAYYKSAEFDETSNRQRFIDPFFAALGWDVADEAKKGPFADVLLEYSLKPHPQDHGQTSLFEEEAEDQRVADALAEERDPGVIGVRRPDYSFRINGQRRFFVEAKRPSVEINSPRPIYQVKSYGWNARTPLAILTDFEDLLVFDCRYQPVLDEPQTGLVPEFKLHFSEYVDNWDLLWDTFSREAVADASLSRFAEEIADRKGQVPVDVAFLADLARWRQSLARDLAKNNTQLDVWNLNDATQRTLDRLVFIRVCEDRGLEPAEVLRPLLAADDPYPLFIKAIGPLRAAYNGGLLDPDFSDQLTVTANVFKRIVRGLYTPWSPYRFDALGVEILGSIYERALGSMVTLEADRSVKVELKPEVRKAGGVYYTPAWVVDEVVRLAIDPLIKGKRPAQLQGFRVLDPACGSGSFLLGAYSRLISHFEQYYTAHPSVDPRSHFEDGRGVRRLTTEAKAQLLRNSIFGVDVDPAAVEVTTMSLYLKSLESDAPEYLRTQGPSHHRRPALRGRERRERRLPAGPVRGGLRARGDGRGRRGRGGRGRGGRAEPRALHALRRLPPAPARVRRARDADSPGRPRARAPHRHARRAAPALLRARGARVSAQAAATVVAERAPGFAPRIGLVLGSGLGALAEELADRVEIPYADLPGFGVSTVTGHAGSLALGRLGRVPVACLRGRSHVYEGAEAAAITTPIRLLALLGARAVLLTNAAGSLRPEVGPGSLVAVSDHINLLGFNPLTGPNDDAVGPRFPSLRDLYDPELRAALHRAADELGTELHDGVYLACAGPSFETPAEIRAFRTLGADLVGMSTVPEAIVARHAGMRVAAVSAVTNLAEGLTDEPLDHAGTLAQGTRAAQALGPLLRAWVAAHG